MDLKETLITKFQNKSARIAILGMGYVGLPLAVLFAEAGYEVTGIDPDKRKIEALNKQTSYIPNVSNEQVAKLVSAGILKATMDFSVLTEMETVQFSLVSRNTLGRMGKESPKVERL